MHELLDLLTGAALATPAAGSPTDAPSTVAVESVWDFVLKGGIMMIPIGLCSLLALSVVFDRIVQLRRRKVSPPDLLAAVDRELEAEASGAAGAIEACRSDGSALAHVLIGALRRAGAARETVERAVQEAAEREVQRLRRFLRVLSVIASVAPLLGLLGTIIGMIIAFQTVATSGEALGRTEMLARGIYQAMITTAAGLSVAIPALICYHWLASIVQRRVLEIDDAVVDFVDRHGLAVDAMPAPAVAHSAVSTNGASPDAAAAAVVPAEGAAT